MIDPVNNRGCSLVYPLQLCDCGQSSCGIAVDQNGYFAYERSTLSSKAAALRWTDIQNEPGWVNGYPPGHIFSFTFSPGVSKFTSPPSELSVDKCDCGAAASDYSISRDGGPGHSDWCKVSGR